MGAISEIQTIQNCVRSTTGAENITSHRLREQEVKQLHSSACCRQEIAIFSPNIHASHGVEVMFSPPQ